MVTYSENQLNEHNLVKEWTARYGKITGPNIIKAQQELGVNPDGYFGPISIAAYIKHTATDNINRTRFRCSHTYKRRKPPQSIVWHDSITRTATTCHRVLERKKYGSHYYIDEDGTIYETCVPSTHYTVHCGPFNQESIGVDVCNLLVPRYLGSNGKDTQRKTRIVTRNWGPYKRAKRVLRPTHKQRDAIIYLAKLLSERHNIPLTMPPNLCIYGEAVKVKDSDYRGHIAHGQLSTRRWDGLFVREIFESQGWVSKPLQMRYK